MWLRWLANGWSQLTLWVTNPKLIGFSLLKQPRNRNADRNRASELRIDSQSGVSSRRDPRG